MTKKQESSNDGAKFLRKDCLDSSMLKQKTSTVTSTLIAVNSLGKIKTQKITGFIPSPILSPFRYLCLPGGVIRNIMGTMPSSHS